MIFTSVKVSSSGGEFSFFTQENERYTLSFADVKRLGLQDISCDNMPMEFQDDELIVFLSSKLSAIKYCTYLLSFSDKSESALKRKMREKGYSSEIIDGAISVLHDSGFTDDESLCLKKYISIANSKLYGPYRIKSELMARGFSVSDINNAEKNCTVEFDDLLNKLITKLTATKMPDFSDKKEVMKFKAKLSRYGYGFDSVNRVFSQYFSDSSDFEQF